ncbi:esterase/lipase family protein [Crateriforma spongiae]|uniref:esterase/lipase family protein n=1 Tax=Crateriforma spongiae TaxID=2724528 RepID=UPI0039AEF5E9
MYQPTARRNDVPTIVGLLSLLLVLSGCCGSFSATWMPVKVMPASTDATVCLVPWNQPSQESKCDQAGNLDTIREIYDRAVQMESDCQSHCVDLYFQVATATLPFDGPLPQGTFDVCGNHADCGCSTAALGRDLHKSALSRLVHSGQRFGRFDHGKHLTVHTESRVVQLPLHRDGFLWRPDDFRFFRLVGDYRTDAIHPLYRTAGRGVPLVVETARGDDDPLVMPNVPFAATLCMTRSNEGQSTVRLTLHDPLRSSQRPGQYRCNDAQPDFSAFYSTDIATDISAPLAYRLSQRSGDSIDNVTSLSDSTGPCRLAAIEPYQPGKIPVIFIHGLGSSPATWVQMVNALRSHPDLVSRFQFWEFEYPRGLPYPTAARKLRSELIRVRHAIDPDFADDALSDCVGVGHSLGGLIAKVISTTPDIDQDPACRIRRIVHIGTPHRGAVPSNRVFSVLVDGVRALRGNMPQDHVPGCPHRSNNIDLTNRREPLLSRLECDPAQRRHHHPFDHWQSLRELCG